MATDVAVVLASGFVGAQEALAREHDAIRYHLALGDRGAEPPGGAEHDLAFGVFAESAAGSAGFDQWLNQHRHRGAGGAQPMIVHVAPGIGGPQRRPAGPHRSEKCGLAVDAQKAFELTGEVRPFAVLDQGGGAYRTRLAARGTLRMPSVA